MRELLAGFKLELGDERAKTAAALKQNEQLAAELADTKAQKSIQPVLIGGAVGIAVGALLSALAFGLSK